MHTPTDPTYTHTYYSLLYSLIT